MVAFKFTRWKRLHSFDWRTWNIMAVARASTAQVSTRNKKAAPEKTISTFAVAPPRLLETGFVDTVTEQSNAYRILQPPSLVNKYAAVPSLHVGWNVLIGIALYRAGRSRIVRAFAVASPLLMGGKFIHEFSL